MTTSERHGTIISQTEVSNISANGLWLICNDHEYFLPYDQFPWFRDAPIKHIFNLEEPHPGHLYWPDLDIDLSLEIIQNPERFPRIANAWLEELAVRVSPQVWESIESPMDTVPE